MLHTKGLLFFFKTWYFLADIFSFSLKPGISYGREKKKKTRNDSSHIADFFFEGWERHVRLVEKAANMKPK